jgi:hypothetical protein
MESPAQSAMTTTFFSVLKGTGMNFPEQRLRPPASAGSFRR